MADQRPVELILARGLMSNITTPAFLVDAAGTLVFFNDAAGELLGMRYEEAGPMELEQWGTRFVPMRLDGRAIPPKSFRWRSRCAKVAPCTSASACVRRRVTRA